MKYGYIFKTYIAGGREHYEYGTDALTWLDRSELEDSGQPAVIKKDFPFPESLLSLLYLDTRELDPLMKRVDKAIREFLPTADERYATAVHIQTSKLLDIAGLPAITFADVLPVYYF